MTNPTNSGRTSGASPTGPTARTSESSTPTRWSTRWVTTARALRYFQETKLLESEDLLVHVQNPAVVADEIAAVYESAATQVLATELTDDGRQHVTLRKSPRGRVGATSLVKFTDEPPFVEVASPPGG
ncbi:MAG: hypothetical protein ABEJ68_03545 [Halobacteriaceae archaeon]